MPKPWEQFQAAPADVSGPWAKFQPPPARKPRVGYGESIMRGGFQGATANFGDEITGGFEAALDKLRNGDEADFSESYAKHRDEARAANKAAETANPKAYMAGELGGGVATSLVPAAGGAKLAALGAKGVKGAMAAGGIMGTVQGAGASEADTLGGVAGDAAISGGLGAAGGGLMKYGGDKAAPRAKAAYDYVADKMSKGGRKALSILGGVHDVNINRYIDRPDAVNAARPMGEIGEHAIDQIGALKNKGIEGSQAATELIPEKGRINVAPIQDKLDELVSRYKGAGGVDNAGPAKAIESWRDDFNGIVKNQKVNLRDLKTLVKNLDRKIKVSERAGTFDSSEHVDKVALRKEIDSLLKGAVPEYKQAMLEVANDFQALKPASQMYGNEKTVSAGVERAARNTGDKQKIQREALKNLGSRSGGPDLLTEAEDRLTKQSFTKDATNGARRTVLGSAVGGGLEAGRQLLSDGEDLDFGRIGMAAAGGSAAGAAADRYGPAMTKGILDSSRNGVVKMTRDQVERVLQAAAAKGPQALRATQFWLEKQFPDFRDMMENGT